MPSVWSTLSDPLRLGIFLYIVISISRIHQHVAVLSALRPGLLLFAFVSGYAFLVPSSVRWANLTRVWPTRLLGVVVFCALCSVPFGLSLGASAASLRDGYSKVVVFSLVLLIGIRDWKDLRVVVWAYVLSIGIQVYMSLFVLGVQVESSGIARLQSSAMYDSNDLGLLLNLGMPLALLCLATSRLGGKVLAGLILLGIPVVIAKTGSRGALVGLVAVGAILFLLLDRVSVVKRLATGVVVAACLTMAAPAGYWHQMKTMFDLEDDYNVTSEDGRWQLIQRGAGYMARYPLFGVGIDNFSRAEGTISSKARSRFSGEGITWTAPHNTYVQVAAELGFFAICAWCSILVGGMIAPARRRKWISRDGPEDAEERFLYAAGTYLPAAFAAFAIPSAFVSFAYLDPFYILVAYLCAYLVAVDGYRWRRWWETASWQASWAAATTPSPAPSDTRVEGAA